MYWRRRLTRLELAAYALIAGVVCLLLVRELTEQMEVAERAAMEQTVSRINSGIALAFASSMLRGDKLDLQSALMRNPIELSKVSLANYAGEAFAPSLGSLPRGSWIFDSASRELIYLPRLHSGLTTGAPDQAIRFRLAVNPMGISCMLVPTSNSSRP